MVGRGRPSVTVTLDDQVRTELARRVRAATASQREARRARIILGCAEGGSAKKIAKRLGVGVGTVERWRERFLKSGLDGLEDMPRAGHASRFGPVCRAELIALACEPIERVVGVPCSIDELVQKAASEGKSNYTIEELTEAAQVSIPVNGVSRRTIEELVETAVQRGIVDKISWSTYQHMLAEIDLRPHLVKGWLHSPDPQFREKVTAITDLYLNFPKDSVVLSIDEKTGMQALQRRYPDRAPAPGRHRRREFEYKRHGTQSLLCSLEVHTGRVIADCGATRTGQDLVSFMERIAKCYPTGTVHVIWDCLNIHFDGVDERWHKFNARHSQRFVFHYTPKHASWVNQVELFFSILQRQCLRHGSFKSSAELRATVLEYIEYWNNKKRRPFRWTFKGYPLQSGIKDEISSEAA
jgi:transposase-like protein